MTKTLTLCAAAMAAMAGLMGQAEAGLPDCALTAKPVPLLSKAGKLESLAFDRAGRLLYTNLDQNTLHVLPKPGATGQVVATGIKAPGGIALGAGPEVYVGTGNDPSAALPSLAKAGIVKVDLNTGAVTPHASGLSSANGLVRSSDGTFYASNALASYLGRVLPDGTVQPRWLKLSGNGLVLNGDESVLYVNQSLPPTRVMAVNLATGTTQVVSKLPAANALSLLDGMGITDDGSLYVAAYLAGQVWRVDAGKGSVCVVARGLDKPSAVVAGQGGQGFEPTSLYVTTHGGSLLELPRVLSQPVQ